MKIDNPKLNQRLGSNLIPESQKLSSDRTPKVNASRGISILDSLPDPGAEAVSHAISYVECNLDESELKLTKELTEAMFTVKTAEEQTESFKTYIRALQFLNVVLVPLNRGLYSSVLIQDLPVDSISPVGRMKFTLNSEMTLYGIGRAAGLKKRNGDEVRDFAPLTSTPEENTYSIDSLIPDPEDCPFAAFYCHRNDRNESINITEVDEVIASLPESSLKVLRKPLFQLSSSDRPNSWSSPVPLFTIENNKQQLALASYNVKAQDESAQQALANIDALLNSGTVGKKLTLKAGDALVLNNDRCLHGSDTHKAISRLWLQSLLLIKADNSVATSDRLRAL